MKYLILLPLSWLFSLLALLLAPILPIFAEPRMGKVNNADKEAIGPRLPKWLSWFDTPDNSLYGDQGHEERWKYAHSYLQMVVWLFRNPAYGFEWNGPLAANIKPEDVVEVSGNPWIKNRDNPVAGWYFCTVGDFWNYKLILPGYLGRLLFFSVLMSILIVSTLLAPSWLIVAPMAALFTTKDLAFMGEFGWKLQPWAQGRPYGDKAMFVFSLRLTAFNKS